MSADKDGIVTKISIALGAKQRKETEAGYTGRWSDLEEAMLSSFKTAHADAADFRHVATQIYEMKLKAIKVQPGNGSMNGLCIDFFEIFPEEIRINWIKRLWADALNHGIDLEDLAEVELLPPSPGAEKAEVEDEYQRPQADRKTESFSVKFEGDWLNVDDAGQSIGTPRASLIISDKTDLSRPVQIGDKSITLGSESEIRVAGGFVSRKHARMFVEDGQLYLEDTGSSNGTWLNGKKLLPLTPMTVSDKSEIRLGGDGNCPVTECSRIIVTLLGHPQISGIKTKLRPTEASPAPNKNKNAKTTGFLLELKTPSDWKERRIISELPVTIGRDDADILTPAENIAVSRPHLRLLKSALEGVLVEDMDSARGCYLNGKKSTGTFLLPWNTPLLLGAGNLNDEPSPVQIVVSES